jgi:ProP effector
MPEVKLSVKDLRKRYPEVFGKAIRPLRVGILQDLVAIHGDRVTRHTLYALLAPYTNSPAYLAAVVRGGPRYSLDGTVSGQVTEDEQAGAKARLELLRQKAEADARARQGRHTLLNAFEGSGLTRSEFAQKNAIAVAKLDSDLANAENERIARRAKRQKLVDRLEQSGLSLEAFAAQANVRLSSLKEAVKKVSVLRGQNAKDGDVNNTGGLTA